MDESGSVASLSRLETLPTYYGESLDSEEIEALNGLTDDFWTLDWIEGTWDIWVPEESGYQRLSSINATTFSTQGLGNEFGSIETLLGQTIDDIFIWGAEAYFTMDGQIGLAAGLHKITSGNSETTASSIWMEPPFLPRHSYVKMKIYSWFLLLKTRQVLGLHVLDKTLVEIGDWVTRWWRLKKGPLSMSQLLKSLGWSSGGFC